MPRHQQVVRQWRLLRRLEGSPCGLTASELADAEGSLERTVYRDLEALQQAGFPLYSEIIEGHHRWKLTDTFRARGGVPLALSELLALRCARSSLDALEGTPFFEGLRELTAKLDAVLSPPVRAFALKMDEVFVGDRFGRPHYDALRPLMETCSRAAADRETLELRYLSQRGGESVRQVDPYNLWVHRNVVYLVAWCHVRKAIRTFSLARVRDARPTGDHFEPDASYDFDAYAGERFRIWGEGQPTRVRIWFSPEAALYVRERTWHRTQQITEAEGGGIELSMEVDGLAEICSWVLGFGPRAKIIEPAELRDRVLAEMWGAMGRYEASRAGVLTWGDRGGASVSVGRARVGPRECRGDEGCELVSSSADRTSRGPRAGND